MRIAVIGSGSWGTALAHLLAGKGFSVTIWGRDTAQVEEINTRHENSRYLPGLTLHPELKASTDKNAALEGVEICLLAVPCQSMRAILKDLAPLLSKIPGLPLVCASKGIETSTLKTMSGVVAEEVPTARYAILSGPSFAAEVIQGLPSAVALGCADKELSQHLRDVFSTDLFRVYSCSDVLGVELGGALKNVIAIAAGLSDGLGFGHNSRAALITRGLAEMSRLGEALGAKSSTFMGLSGMGDLVLTCTGDLSRNRQVGLRLAAGRNVGEIVEDLHMVAEGVKTTEAVVALASACGIEMPVADTVYSILKQKISMKEGVRGLMTRSLKDE